jgi:hypothetical protein
MYRSAWRGLFVVVTLPCACVHQAAKGGIWVMLVMTLDNQQPIELGTVAIDRNAEGEGGPSPVCSFSQFFPVVLSLKREMLVYLEVIAEVWFDMGTHTAGAQDRRQVMRCTIRNVG